MHLEIRGFAPIKEALSSIGTPLQKGFEFDVDFQLSHFDPRHSCTRNHANLRLGQHQ